VNIFERAFRRVDELQQQHAPMALVFGVVKKFGDDNGGVLVSNLAYSAFLALFPLLLLLITVLGLVLSAYPSAEHAVLHSAFGEFPVVGRQLGSNIHALRRSSAVGLTIGLLGLLWGSMGLAQAAMFAMSQVWNVPGPDRPNFLHRLARGVVFLGVLGTGLLLSAFLAGFGTFGQHDVALGLLGEVLALAVNVGQYLLAFRVLTPRAVRTRRLIPGAVAGGVAWTILLAVGGYLIGHDLRNDSAIYGLFGMVLGLLAWVYLGAEISIYAAELNTVLARGLRPRALVQPPLTAADQRVLALQATQNRRRPEQHVDVSFSEPPMTERERRVFTDRPDENDNKENDYCEADTDASEFEQAPLQ
jgi:YihY family inner membrane protein